MKLSEHSPHLKKEFSNKNSISFESLSHGSKKKIIWECSLGHEWIQDVNNRTNRGSGCAVCSGKQVQVGFNDLASSNPELAKEWSDKNLFKPTDMTRLSNKKAWWICPLGHEYEAVIANRFRGSGCPVCSNKKIINGVNDLGTRRPEMIKEWGNKNNVSINEIGPSYKEKINWECTKNHNWTVSPDNRRSGQGCPHCVSFTSKAEDHIYDFVKSIDSGAKQSDRELIKPYELDILVPGKLAIEYNGLYWHSKKDKKYHQNKFQKCKEAGVQLLTIWEDDWRDRQDIVKKMIVRKLGHNKSIGARQTQVKKISYQQSSTFLNEWHIQGSARGSNYFALIHQNKIVAVAVFKKNQNSIYLERYASSLTVIGGLNKLMKANGPGDYITFADNAVSNGGLYEKTGWESIGSLKPDYSYVVNDTRVHKFNYRLKRFKSDSELIYIEGYTESQLAELNNLPRLWDCGKTKYTKTI